MPEFRMPSLGADMDAGTVSQWLVNPGDQVKKGDIVAVVETDKSTVEVECFETGTARELLIPPGRRVPVGTVLATILEPGECPTSPPSRMGVIEPPEEPGPQPVRLDLQSGEVGGQLSFTPAEVPERRSQPPHVASPLVRHLAHQRHLQLSAIQGTGSSGVITREDVERAAAVPARVKASTWEPPSI